jgi:hypothetical protein
VHWKRGWQIVTVTGDRVLASTQRRDGGGHYTGCQPRKGDDVFLFKSGGVVEHTTTISGDNCDWTGDFTIPGKFQAQDCHPR